MWNVDAQPVLLVTNSLAITGRSHLSCLAFSPNGTLIATGSRDGTLCVWDSTSGKCMLGPLAGQHVLPLHVSSVTFSSTGDHFVSGSWYDTILVWDAKTGQCISKMPRCHLDRVTSVMFSSDGKTIVSSSWDTTIRIWDWEKFLTPAPVLTEDGWLEDEQGRRLLWIPPDLRPTLLWDEAHIDALGSGVSFSTRLDLSKFREDSWLSWDQSPQ